MGSREYTSNFQNPLGFKKTTMTSASTCNPIPKLAHRLLLFACVFTWPLLFVGGLVTTYRVGMSVPDWPTTFGINMFVYNFLNAAWGVFIEHGHRLYGSAVGLCLLILAPWIQSMKQVPHRFKLAVWAALLGVIVQGVMGGLRVTQISTTLAMVHGCFAQLFFLYLALLAAWSGPSRVELSSPDFVVPSLTTKRFSGSVVLLVYAQIVAGAWLRHFQSPDKLYLHATLGLVVLVTVTSLGVRIRREGLTSNRSIRRIKTLLVGFTHMQWLLGLAAWWMMRPFDGQAKPVSDLQAIFRTAHQANGALVLAFSGVAALWLFQASGSVISRSQAESARLEAACLS